MTSLQTILLNLTKRLFPTGRAFRSNKGSVSDDVQKGLIVSESEMIEGYESILSEILADNENFTEENASDWERRLAIRASSNTDLEIRKAAILRKYAAPGDIPARSHYTYLQRELRAAGFDVYVHENRFFPGPTTKHPSEFSFYSNAPQIQLAQFQLGQFQLGQIDIEKVVNFINNDKDRLFVIGTDLRATFYVGSLIVGDVADINADRKDEFRQLILQIKPLQTVGILFINYIPSYIMNEQKILQVQDQIDADEYVYALQIVGKYLYIPTGTVNNTGRLLLFDLTSPTNPVFVKEIEFSVGIPYIDISGLFYDEPDEILWITGGQQNPTFSGLDVSDPLNPVAVGDSGLGGFGLRPMFRFNKGGVKYLYTTMISPRVTVLNVTNPAAITQNNPSDPNLGPSQTTAMNGKSNNLFVAEIPGDGIKVFDLFTDPLEPAYLFTESASLVNTSRIFRGIYIDSNRNYLYGLLDQNDDDDTAVVVFDISNIIGGSIPVLGKLIAPGAVAPPNFRYSLRLEGNFVSAMTGPSGLYVWDIRDLGLANTRLQIFSGVVPNESGNSAPFQTRNNHAYIPSGDGNVGDGFYIVPHEIVTEN